HDAALRGRGLRAPGTRAARASDGAARRPSDVRSAGGGAALVIALAALAAYPLVGSGYGLRAVLQVFTWIALAGAWNLIAGLTGYVSFGHVAFFGAGAYTGGVLMASAGWSWPLPALPAGVAAGVLALAIVWACF